MTTGAAERQDVRDVRPRTGRGRQERHAATAYRKTSQFHSSAKWRVRVWIQRRRLYDGSCRQVVEKSAPAQSSGLLRQLRNAKVRLPADLARVAVACYRCAHVGAGSCTTGRRMHTEQGQTDGTSSEPGSHLLCVNVHGSILLNISVSLDILSVVHLESVQACLCRHPPPSSRLQDFGATL